MNFEILEVIVRDIPSFHSLAIKASRDFCERIVKNVTYLARVSSNRMKFLRFVEIQFYR